jgi:hypothetical protein
MSRSWACGVVPVTFVVVAAFDKRLAIGDSDCSAISHPINTIRGKKPEVHIHGISFSPV